MPGNKTTALSRAQSLAAGTSKHLNGTSVTFGGVTYTFTALTALLQSYITLFLDVNAARQTYSAKLQAQRDQGPALAVLVALYRAFILVTFAKKPDILADFGLTGPKPKAVPTAKEKVEAVDLRAATRVLRHTMGKKQREGIKATSPQPTTASAPGPVAAQASSQHVAPAGASATATGGSPQNGGVRGPVEP